jgi:DNA-binding MarR family transcriptional regulator
MATLADRVLQTLRVTSRALDDDELAKRLGVIRQQINQACNRLANQGLLRRYVGPENKLVNQVVEGKVEYPVVRDLTQLQAGHR